jgi:hypothetical protein
MAKQLINSQKGLICIHFNQGKADIFSVFPIRDIHLFTCQLEDGKTSIMNMNINRYMIYDGMPTFGTEWFGDATLGDRVMGYLRWIPLKIKFLFSEKFWYLHDLYGEFAKMNLSQKNNHHTFILQLWHKFVVIY